MFLCNSLPTTEGIRDAWVRVWSSRREAPALRAALARLASARTRLIPTSTHFEMHPALSLHVSPVTKLLLRSVNGYSL